MRAIRRAITSLLVLALLAVGGAAPAGADSLDDLRDRTNAAKEKKAAAEARIEDLSADLEDTDAELAAAYVRLQEIEGELLVAQAELEEAEGELLKAQREADALAQRLTDAEAQEAELVDKIAQDDEAAQSTRESIAELARRAYRGEGTPDRMSLVMGASSAQDFVQQYSLSQTAMRTQTNSLDLLRQTEATSRNTQSRLEAVRGTIADLKVEADAAVVVAADAKADAEERRSTVEGLIVEQKNATALIEDRRQSQEAARDEAAADREAFDAEIQELAGLTAAEKKRISDAEAKAKADAEAKAKADAEARAKNNQSGGSGSGSTPATPSQPTTPSNPSGGAVGRGFLDYPTSMVYITSAYGYRLHPILGYVRLHAGTDFRAYCGTPIMASAAGTVRWATMRSGFGNQVLVDHGTVDGASLMTSYNHLSSFAVSAGAKVSKGQVIGYSGNTGTSSACHLHFEVYVNGATVNPMSVL